MTTEALSSTSKASFFARWLRLSRISLLLMVLAAATGALVESEAVMAAAGVLFVLCGLNAAILYRVATYHIVSISMKDGIATIQAARFNASGRSMVPAHQVAASVSRVPMRIPALWKLTLDHGGQLIARQYSIEDWTEQKLREAASVFETARKAAEE
jgi:hypothetical protein